MNALSLHRTKLEIGLKIGVWILFFSVFSSSSGIGVGTALVGLFGLLLFWPQLRDWKRLPLLFPIAALCLALVVSVIFAEGDKFSKPLMKLRYFGVYFLLVLTFAHFTAWRDRLARVSVWFAIVLAVVAVLQFFGIFDPVHALGLLKDRLAAIPQADGRFFQARGFLHHHNPFGFTSLMIYHLLLGQAISVRDKREKRFFWIGVVAMAVGILASCSRGSWLALVASTAIVCVTVAREHWRTFAKAGAVLALIAVILGAPLWQRLSHVAPRYNSERLALWRICIEMFKESPLVGNGYHRGFELQRERFMTPEELATPTFPKDPHSAYFDLLGTTGLLGFGTFLIFLFSALSGYLRALALGGTRLSAKERGYLVGGLGAFLCFVIGAGFDSHFYHTQVFVAMLFFLGLGQSVVYQNDEVLHQVGLCAVPAGRL